MRPSSKNRQFEKAEIERPSATFDSRSFAFGQLDNLVRRAHARSCQPSETAPNQKIKKLFKL